MEAFGLTLPWWAWFFFFTGVIAFVGVVSALFLPDWPTPPFRTPFRAPPGSDAFIENAAALLNVPLFQGGTVEVLENGDAFYPKMLEAIREAKETVNFEVYIFEPDEVGRVFMEAFKERARAGVQVRLLVDAFGSLKLDRKSERALREAGVRVERFRPFKLRHLIRIYRRTHRRAIVIDGRLAFTGGAAVSKKWIGNVRNEHEWRDSMVRITGPLVAGIQAAFIGNWTYCTGEILTGPAFFPPLTATPGMRSVSVMSSPSDARQPIRLLFWWSFASAERRLWISNSYFVPDEHLRAIVIERAAAGVDVRILVPGNHTDAVPVQWAGRTFYDELLSGGVRIFEYQPAMMHAKVVVIDERWSIVGSSNLDERSIELNEENIAGIADATLAAEIERGFLEDFARAREIHLSEWRRRPRLQRALEAVAKILIEQY